MQTEWQTVSTLIRSSLICVCTVCPGISVRKLRIIMVCFYAELINENYPLIIIKYPPYLGSVPLPMKGNLAYSVAPGQRSEAKDIVVSDQSYTLFITYRNFCKECLNNRTQTVMRCKLVKLCRVKKLYKTQTQKPPFFSGTQLIKQRKSNI